MPVSPSSDSAWFTTEENINSGDYNMWRTQIFLLKSLQPNFGDTEPRAACTGDLEELAAFADFLMFLIFSLARTQFMSVQTRRH